MDGSAEPREADPRRALRVALVAQGCRVSRADADAFAAELSPAFRLAAAGEGADYVVVSTCTVTGDAERAARQALRRAAREHPGARVVAAGCWASLAPAEAAALPGVAAVVGARSHAALAGVLERLRAGAAGPEAVRAAEAAAAPWGRPPVGPARHTRPALKVQDGCDGACAYCVVPLARGPSRSLPWGEARRRLAALGARHAEVVLTGVHLGAYGRDLAPRRTLAALARDALASGAVRRLRLSSVEPGEVPLDLLSAPEADGLCPHLHLPLQSGSDRLLAAMRRPYTAATFREVVRAAAAARPGLCVGADVMVGFPGEREEDHRATVALVEALPVAYLHVFPFSPRPGTEAAGLPDPVPVQVARRRAAELRAVSDRRWRAFLDALVGREVEVAVERIADGLARGTSREWAPVRWPASGEARGEAVRVRILASDGAACHGARAA